MPDGAATEVVVGPEGTYDIRGWWSNDWGGAYTHRFAPNSGSGESYAHEGEEFLLVLRGELQLALDGEEFRLKSGDSFYFESATPHHWKNPGRAETWVLWVNTPPTF